MYKRQVLSEYVRAHRTVRQTVLNDVLLLDLCFECLEPATELDTFPTSFQVQDMLGTVAQNVLPAIEDQSTSDEDDWEMVTDAYRGLIDSLMSSPMGGPLEGVPFDSSGRASLELEAYQVLRYTTGGDQQTDALVRALRTLL